MATLKDVAKLAEVSVTTVSRVINNRGYISTDTYNKVHDAMKVLNYQPDEIARSLLKKQTNLIGLIVPSITHPFFSVVIEEIEKNAAKKGYKLLLINSNNRTEATVDAMNMLKANKTAGIVLCNRTLDFDKYVDSSFPIISLERENVKDSIVIACDNFRGGELAANLLISKGCKHLVHISGSYGIKLPANQREEGFSSVCEENNVNYHIIRTTEEQFLEKNYMQQINEVFKKHPKVDGIFASSDIIGMQVIQYCHSNKIDVPGKLKVVGFDNINESEYIYPRLTTVEQPIASMCEHAIHLISKSNEGEIVAKNTLFPVNLIERQST